MKKSLLLNSNESFFKEVRFIMKKLNFNTMTAAIVFAVMEYAKSLKK